jgi:hypothetical protein
MSCTKRKNWFWRFHKWGRTHGPSDNPLPPTGEWKGEAFQGCRACGMIRSLGIWERDRDGFWNPEMEAAAAIGGGK